MVRRFLVTSRRQKMTWGGRRNLEQVLFTWCTYCWSQRKQCRSSKKQDAGGPNYSKWNLSALATSQSFLRPFSSFPLKITKYPHNIFFVHLHPFIAPIAPNCFSFSFSSWQSDAFPTIWCQMHSPGSGFPFAETGERVNITFWKVEKWQIVRLRRNQPKVHNLAWNVWRLKFSCLFPTDSLQSCTSPFAGNN